MQQSTVIQLSPSVLWSSVHTTRRGTQVVLNCSIQVFIWCSLSRTPGQDLKGKVHSALDRHTHESHQRQAGRHMHAHTHTLMNAYMPAQRFTTIHIHYHGRSLRCPTDANFDLSSLIIIIIIIFFFLLLLLLFIHKQK